MFETFQNECEQCGKFITDIKIIEHFICITCRIENERDSVEQKCERCGVMVFNDVEKYHPICEECIEKREEKKVYELAKYIHESIPHNSYPNDNCTSLIFHSIEQKFSNKNCHQDDQELEKEKLKQYYPMAKELLHIVGGSLADLDHAKDLVDISAGKVRVTKKGNLERVNK